MKIAASDLGLQASQFSASREQSSESLRAWRGERLDFEGMAADVQSAVARISDAARQLLSANQPSPQQPAMVQSGEAQAVEAAQDAVDNDPFLSMIRQMIQFLTGEEVKVFDIREFSAGMRQGQVELQAASSARTDWGVEYDAHRLYEEFEQTTFSTSGKIRTADGQEFSFTLDLEMTRYYREESSVSVRAGNAARKDPLVVNFGGTGTQLLDKVGQGFRFDLDGDGQADWLPLFRSASGFLALDRNGNGKIDSGRELFGPHSGNGFTDLAVLDEDSNGWIDEGDSAFDNLLVWTPAMEGSGTLRSLADAGIGALGLAHVASPFALRGNENADLGLIQSTGVYLGENGQAGSLQEIDITV